MLLIFFLIIDIFFIYNNLMRCLVFWIKKSHGSHYSPLCIDFILSHKVHVSNSAHCVSPGALATPTLSPDPGPSPASPADVHQAPLTFSPGDTELSMVEELQDGHLETVNALV